MRYTVKHHSEEFACLWCGAPVYVGDAAYQCGPDETPYCSQRCAEADRFDTEQPATAAGESDTGAK
jgi:hypothetical protein